MALATDIFVTGICAGQNTMHVISSDELFQNSQACTAPPTSTLTPESVSSSNYNWQKDYKMVDSSLTNPALGGVLNNFAPL